MKQSATCPATCNRSSRPLRPAGRALLSGLSIGLLLTLTACGSTSSSGGNSAQDVDLGADFAMLAEVDRLRFFREIHADQARQAFNVSGSGVRVTVMGEVADASHPELRQRIMNQYNTISEKDQILRGTGNQPVGYVQFGAGDGHGTHIAGTIAAACDGVGIQGVACGAELDVYDIGAYGNPAVPQAGWGDTHEFERLLVAFRTALDDVAANGASRIVTGSFNLESPAIAFSPGGRLDGLSVSEMIAVFDSEVSDVADLANNDLVRFQNPDDLDFLERMVAQNEDDASIAMMALLTQSSQWEALADSIAVYQQGDGVYIVTESNYHFDTRTSTLNAMPALSDKVDPALWISAVMAQPVGLAEAMQNPDFTDDDMDTLIQGGYETPLNSCGEIARDYCILVPSYQVLSTMTRQLADPGLPMYLLDDMTYQVFDGHSMGAPMIAGALALMDEYNQREQRGHSMRDLVRILKDSANRSFPGYDSARHGRGLLDIEAAIGAM